MPKVDILKEVVIEKDRTSKWLAESLDKGAETLSSWRNNRIQPSLGTLDKTSKLLEVDKLST